jgi:putative transposase
MNKGIHSRGYLPHWDFSGSVQGITFRLADAVPVKVIQAWRQELSLECETDSVELRQKIAKYEDAGHGSCLLGKPMYAKVMQEILVKRHGSTYKLIDWSIMPNHVHVLIRLLDNASLGKIIKQWKAPAAMRINQIEGRSGSLWMRDYHDRWIRDEEHFLNARAYIRKNPVKVGLCGKPEDWEFSSVGCHWDADYLTPTEEAK